VANETPQAPIETPKPVELSKDVLDTIPNTEGHAFDLERHFQAMVNLEKYFPQLVRIAGRICVVLETMGKVRKFNPSKVTFTVKIYDDCIAAQCVPDGDMTPAYGQNTKHASFNSLKAIDA
jgi:hypothetical protein